MGRSMWLIVIVSTYSVRNITEILTGWSEMNLYELNILKFLNRYRIFNSLQQMFLLLIIRYSIILFLLHMSVLRTNTYTAHYCLGKSTFSDRGVHIRCLWHVPGSYTANEGKTECAKTLDGTLVHAHDGPTIKFLGSENHEFILLFLILRVQVFNGSLP